MEKNCCKYKDILERLVSAVERYQKGELGVMVLGVARQELNDALARANALLRKP